MTTPSDLKQQQHDLWSAAAGEWDRWDASFARQTQPLTDWLCRYAGLSAGKHVLDIACGSGQPAVTAARRVNPGGRVVATDISEEMLAVARRKARQADLDNIEFRAMDAEHLEFEDDSFDAVTCRFGLMFCPDPVKAASEIRRVLKPGARFSLAVWDEPSKNPQFTTLTAPIMQALAQPPPDPKAPGTFRLAPASELHGVLSAAGFSQFEVEARPLTLEYASVDEFWGQMVGLSAPIAAALRRLPESDLPRVREMVAEAVKPHVQAGRVRMTGVPLCAWGQK